VSTSTTSKPNTGKTRTMANRRLPDLDYYADHVARQVAWIERAIANEEHDDEMMLGRADDRLHRVYVRQGRTEKMEPQP
jgi:hypothetical protein